MPNSNTAKIDNQKEVARLISDIQDAIIKRIQQQLKEDDINFTGDLSDSFVKGKEGNFQTVETNNNYAGFIEFGMPSGQAIDFNALRIWVEGKLGIPEGDELTATTWAIYKAISENGIRPRRFMKKAIRKFIGLYGTTSIKSSKKGNKRGKELSFGAKVKKAVRNVKKLISGFKSSKLRKRVIR